jgi:hypothetical protein
MDSGFYGSVTSGGLPVSGASVLLLDNPLINTLSAASGAYSLTTPAGTYTLRGSKRGYFPFDVSGTVVSGSSTPVNIPLTKKLVGLAQGVAYVNTHLVLSEIAAEVGGNDSQEYVELYNGTESTYTMTNGGWHPSYTLEVVYSSGGAAAVMNPDGAMHWVNTILYPHHYFLVASTPTVNGVTADVYYSDVDQGISTPDNRLIAGASAGVRLKSNGVYEAAGLSVDAVGWGHSGGGPWGPSGLIEGTTGFRLSGGGDGLSNNESIERIAYSTSTESMMLGTGIHAAMGNAFDSNDNSTDWVDHTSSCSPQNTGSIEDPRTGTPASGAAIYIDDGLSSSAMAASTGSFTVTSIATGTWSIVISSGGRIYQRDTSVAVVSGSTVTLGCLVLNNSTSLGYAGGRVINGIGAPVPNIAVTASGGSDTTDSNGYYRLQLDAGTYIIMANPNNSSSQSYTVGEADGIAVSVGIQTDVPDITIQSGGKLKLWVTSNGTDPLPEIPVVSTDSTGAEVASSVTDSLGYVTFPDLALGTYTVTPQLETGETANPTSRSGVVIAGTTVMVGTITISNAFGTIGGTCMAGTNLIQTGALIIAVPQPTTIVGNPPTLDSTLRSGSTYYYIGSAKADGTYEISLRGGVTYNVYAWYTTYSGTSPTTTPRSATVTVTAGGSGAANFTW